MSRSMEQTLKAMKKALVEMRKVVAADPTQSNQRALMAMEAHWVEYVEANGDPDEENDLVDDATLRNASIRAFTAPLSSIFVDVPKRK